MLSAEVIISKGSAQLKWALAFRRLRVSKGRNHIVGITHEMQAYSYVNPEHGLLITTSGKVFGSPIDVGQSFP